MAKTLLISSHDPGSASTANTTQYLSLAGYSHFTGTETARQITMRAAGTISNLLIRVITESFSADCTFRTRVNAANGGQSVAFQATGLFEDTVGTDALADGDEVAVQSVPPAAGTYNTTWSGATFAATTNTVNILGIMGGWALTTASRTAYQRLDGYTDSEGDTTEANVNCEQRKSGTFNKLLLNITSNARTTTTTFRTRDNSTDGGQSIAITTNTGIVEDTTGSDAVVAGDNFNFQHVTGTGAQNLTVGLSVNFTSTASISEYVAGRNAAQAYTGTSTTTYHPIQGLVFVTTTEAQSQNEVPDTWTFSELTVNITANTMDVGENNVFTFRENGIATAMVVTNGPGTTGIQSDSVNTVSSVVNDLVTVEMNPAGQVGDSVTCGVISVWATGPADAGGVTDEERYLSVNTIPRIDYPPHMEDLLSKIGGSRTNIHTF